MSSNIETVTFMRLKTDGEWHKPLQFVRYTPPHSHLWSPTYILETETVTNFSLSNKTAPFEEKEFVRANFKTRIYHEPTYYVDFPDSVRCGRGNMDWAGETEVLTVKAGEELQIAHHNFEPFNWLEEDFNCANGAGTCRPSSEKPFFVSLCCSRKGKERDESRLTLLLYLGDSAPWSAAGPSLQGSRRSGYQGLSWRR